MSSQWNTKVKYSKYLSCDVNKHRRSNRPTFFTETHAIASAHSGTCSKCLAHEENCVHITTL